MLQPPAPGRLPGNAPTPQGTPALPPAAQPEAAPQLPLPKQYGTPLAAPLKLGASEVETIRGYKDAKDEAVSALKSKLREHFGIPDEMGLRLSYDRETGSALGKDNVIRGILTLKSGGKELQLPVGFEFDPAKGSLRTAAFGGAAVKDGLPILEKAIKAVESADGIDAVRALKFDKDGRLYIFATENKPKDDGNALPSAPKGRLFAFEKGAVTEIATKSIGYNGIPGDYQTGAWLTLADGRRLDMYPGRSAIASLEPPVK